MKWKRGNNELQGFVLAADDFEAVHDVVEQLELLEDIQRRLHHATLEIVFREAFLHLPEGRESGGVDVLRWKRRRTAEPSFAPTRGRFFCSLLCEKGAAWSRC